MTQSDFKPQPVPDNSKNLVRLLKLRLTTAIIDDKPGEAKVYVDIIERISRMSWLDDLTPSERNAQKLEDRARLAARMDAYIANWMKENP